MIFRGKSDRMALREKGEVSKNESDQQVNMELASAGKKKRKLYINWGTVIFRVVLVLVVLGFIGLMRTNFMALKHNEVLKNRIISLEEKTKAPEADYTEAALQKFLSDFYSLYISRSNPENFEVQDYESKLSAYMASHVILPERERNAVMCYISYFTTDTIKRVSDSELEVRGTVRYKTKTKESIEAKKAKKASTEYLEERKDVFSVRVQIVDDKFLIVSVPALIVLDQDEVIADKSKFVAEIAQISGKTIEDKDQLKEFQNFVTTYLQKYLTGAKDIEYISKDTMVLGGCSLVDIKNLVAYEDNGIYTVKVTYRMQVGKGGAYVVWQNLTLTISKKGDTYFITDIERGR